MAKVYSFKRFDGIRDEWVFPALKRTAEYVDKIEGVILPDTEEDVPDSAVDQEGRYIKAGQ